MVEFARIHPYYSFDENKGYGTRAHLEALELRGPCFIHRRSFRRVESQAETQDSLLA